MSQNQKNNFPDISKRILQPSFFMASKKMDAREIVLFWEQQLSDKQNAYSYICDLIKQIASFEKDKKISNASHTISLENLLCTLFVVSMFREFDKKNELTTFRADKECSILQRSASSTMLCPHTVSIVENFFQIHSDASEPNFLSNLIGQICCFPDLTKQNLDTFNQESHIIQHLQNYYKQLEKYTHTIQEESSTHYSMLLLPENQLQETGEFSYTYEFFLKFMRQKKRIVPRVVFDIIVRYFKVLPQIAKEFPEQAEKSILCLLHLTKQVITYFGVRDNESIRTVLSQVQVFRRWPYPVGNMAQELVSILFKEKKLNGNAFRFKVREEIPTVDIEQSGFLHSQTDQRAYYQNDDQQNNMHHQAINMPPSDHQYGESHRALYKAHIIADKDQGEINYLCQLSKLLVRECRISSEHILRTALVTNMLSLSLNTHPDQDIPGIMSKKKKSDVFKIYCQLLRIFEKWDKLDDLVDIQLLQKDQFGKIINLILPLPNDEHSKEEAIHNVLSENFLTFIPEFPYPSLEPTVKFTGGVGYKQSTSKVHMHTMQQIDENYNIYMNMYYPLISEVDAKKMMNQGQFLEQFCHNFLDLETVRNNPQYQEPHRFVVMGGDAELHGLVQLLGEFFDKNDNKLMNSLDLRVYIVPTKKNTLAHYLASKDVWYQRYLYLPFREELIVPKLEKSEENTEKGYFDPFKFDPDNKNTLKTPMLPQELRLQVLHTFIREANRAFNVRIYKAYCSFLNNSSTIIYFCQYLEIGESVRAEIINRQKSLKKGETHPSLYEMKEKNAIKFNGVDLRIKFQSVDYLGNKWKEEVYEENFSNIKVNNVYKEYFEGNTPFPNSHWLEMTCITQENAKLFDSNLRNKHLFRKNAKDPMSGADQVQAAFKALFTSIPVETLEIEAQDTKMDQKSGQQSFNVLIDGKIFNDLKRIIVEPVYMKDPSDPSKDNPHIFLSLPVMTFLPLKL